MEHLLKSTHVHMSHPEIVHKKLQKIVEDGLEKLMFISDFDHTLSRYMVKDGSICATTPQILRQIVLGKHPEMEPTYTEMVSKFLAVECCPLMTVEEKIPMMEEWYARSQEYAIHAEITRHELKEEVRNSNIALRDHTEFHIQKISKHGIPHIVFSAGMGEVIECVFENMFEAWPKGLHIVSNMMEFDDQDRIIGFSKPTIHTFNKNSSVVNENCGFMDEVKGRTNVILMGDSLGDPTMDVGIRDEGIALKIGFLNRHFETHRAKYLEIYDIVIEDEQTMDVPMKIFENILEHLSN